MSACRCTHELEVHGAAGCCATGCRCSSYRAEKDSRPQPRRARLKPVSDRRRAENIERRLNIEAAFGRFPACAIGPVLRTAVIECSARGRALRAELTPAELRALDAARAGCTGSAVDAHEVLTRGRGGSITDPDNVLPGCRPCHDYVTRNPRVAGMLALILPSWHDEGPNRKARR